MERFRDKVAVITGAANGIGLGLARRCAREGMKLVLADIEETALSLAEKEMKTAGTPVLAVPTDVSKGGDLEALARQTLEEFGAVHLLFNNAGVATGGPVWEKSLADWEWVINVDLWGVIHGVRTFVPIMLDQGDECYIVNTSSIAGLNSGVGSGTYRVAKHGVVTLSESLYHDLKVRKAKIGVSVFCPGPISTLIFESARNRPPELGNRAPEHPPSPEESSIREWFQNRVRNGMPPEKAADHVFDAIRQNRFYILTHPEYKEAIRMRMEDILQDRAPTLPPMELQ